MKVQQKSEFIDTRKYPLLEDIYDDCQAYLDKAVYKGIKRLKFKLWMAFLIVFGCDLLLGCIPEIDMRKLVGYRRTVLNWIA